MKEKLFTIILFILLFFLLSLLFMLKKQIKRSQIYEKRIAILYKNVEESFPLNSNLKSIIQSEFMLDNYQLFDTRELHEDSIRYLLLVSRAGCHSCIDQQISFIESYNRQHHSNIGIVFSNETVRGLQLFKHMRKITSNLFVTQYSEELEDAVIHSPLLVSLEKDGRIRSAFQPMAEFPELTNKFLDLNNH